MRGHKIVEVRLAWANKGEVVARLVLRVPRGLHVSASATTAPTRTCSRACPRRLDRPRGRRGLAGALLSAGPREVVQVLDRPFADRSRTRGSGRHSPPLHRGQEVDERPARASGCRPPGRGVAPRGASPRAPRRRGRPSPRASRERNGRSRRRGQVALEKGGGDPGLPEPGPGREDRQVLRPHARRPDAAGEGLGGRVMEGSDHRGHVPEGRPLEAALADRPLRVALEVPDQEVLPRVQQALEAIVAVAPDTAPRAPCAGRRTGSAA